MVEAWVAADVRPKITPLSDDYRISSRLDTMANSHHMIPRGGPGIETRLQQTSLYRPDLDLLVLDGAGEVAAYGLFWFDPTTSTGLVEPLRTEHAQQRRGLARRLLSVGVDRLVEA